MRHSPPRLHDGQEVLNPLACSAGSNPLPLFLGPLQEGSVNSFFGWRTKFRFYCSDGQHQVCDAPCLSLVDELLNLQQRLFIFDFRE